MKKQSNVIKEMELYNDYDVDYICYREEYADIYGEVKINDTKFYDWVSDCLNNDWEDLMTNIENSQYGANDCVIIGNLGLWNGRVDITPTRCNSLTDAIKKCVGECPSTIIKLVEGHIEVCAIHHDGRNYFEIYLLNNLALKTEGAKLEKECYHKIIRGYLF